MGGYKCVRLLDEKIQGKKRVIIMNSQLGAIGRMTGVLDVKGIIKCLSTGVHPIHTSNTCAVYT